MTHQPGTIIIPIPGQMRYPQFTYSLATLRQPDDTALHIIASASVAENINAAIREMHGQWVWICGDDHVFSPDLLMRLLDREEDIVAPVCYTRVPPFTPVIYRDEGTKVVAGREYPAYERVGLHELPQSGLVEVDAVGSAGLLVRKHVLDTIGDPWFAYSEGAIVNEDLEFCRRAREHGYRVHVDTGLRLGHIGNYVIWPEHRGTRSGFLIDLGGQGVNEVLQLTENETFAHA